MCSLARARRESAVADEQPAVTLSIAKRPGANAISVAHEVLKKVEALKGRVIPNGVQVAITRHYGQTAEEKSDELLLHMGIAVIGVSLLILLTLGWRESIIVGIAIPCTLALTLLVFYLHGYTLNRITLFALIFSIGILVDDAIVVVENIVRHFHLPQNKGRPWSAIAVEAVNEVGNPTILATFAVISAVLPMAFVGGLMGPYMRPIPIGSSAAMFWSLAIAFIVTPWAAIRILRWGRKYSRLTEGAAAAAESGKPHSHFEHEEDFFTRLYRRFMGPMIAKARWRLGLPGGNRRSAPRLHGDRRPRLGEGEDAAVRQQERVPDHPQHARRQRAGAHRPGRPRDRRRRARRAGGDGLPDLRRRRRPLQLQRPGAPLLHAPRRPHRRLAGQPRFQERAQSPEPRHRQTRPPARRRKSPPNTAPASPSPKSRPGPPVLQTLVAEVYGPNEESRLRPGPTRSSTSSTTPRAWWTPTGISRPTRPRRGSSWTRKRPPSTASATRAIAQTLQMAVGGAAVDLLHLPREKEDVQIVVRLPQSLRTSPEDLLALRVRGANPAGALVPLRELVKVEPGLVDKSIYHKNLMPVTYVIGDVAGVVESPVYAILKMNEALRALDTTQFGGSGAPLKIYNATQPFTEDEPAIKWDGEWHITIEVFRDLGSAFAAVLVLIFILMVGWFRSFLTPLVVMAAIPFSLVGILPAHGLLGAFFTATSMIGFMAGAGIVVRNSIILVDFIELRLAEGMPLDQAVVDAGAVRFRPMLLTALAVVVGASVILADPIFQGLAISLMAGEIASLLISRMAVPVLYFMAYSRKAAVDAASIVSPGSSATPETSKS